MQFEVLTIYCRTCNKPQQVGVHTEAYNQWKKGKTLIQDALPELSAAERELFISQTCVVCWDQMFGQGVTEHDEQLPDDEVDSHTEEIPEQEAV